MKKINLLFCLIFISILTFCQGVSQFVIVDNDVEFVYRITEIKETSPNVFNANLFSTIDNKNITVKQGDFLSGFNFTDDDLKIFNDIAKESAVSNKKREIENELSTFFKSKNLKIPEFSHLLLDDVIRMTEADKNRVDDLKKTIVVKEIRSGHVILEDSFRKLSFKLIFTPEDKYQMKVNYKTTELDVVKTSSRIVVDGIKDSSYGKSVNVNGFEISTLYDNENIYFYIEYIYDEPVMKTEDLYIMKYNEDTESFYYDPVKADVFSQFVFVFFNENEIRGYLEGRQRQANFDLWEWGYYVKNSKYLNDMNGMISNQENVSGDYSRARIESDDRRNRFFFVAEDTGSSFSESASFTPEMFIGDFYIPTFVNHSPGFSKEDVIAVSSFTDNTSPYISGKISLELKRKLNTNQKDDIEFKTNSAYILLPVVRNKGINYTIDFSNSIKMNFK